MNRFLFSYQNDFLAATALVLLAVLLMFRFLDWEPSQEPVSFVSFDDISIDDVMITTQQATRPPPPPRPSVQPPVIGDDVLEDEPDFSDIAPDASRFQDMPEGDFEGEAGVVAQPDRPPRVRRIVEAVTPDEARNLDFRIEVQVTLLVDANGRVDEVSVSSIHTIDTDGNRTRVEAVGYGIIDEVVRAASRWQFIPALHNGEQVASYSTHRFTF